MLNFNILKEEGKARRAKLGTAHGEINTPAFMPVGTVGTVKALRIDTVKNVGAEILLGNTYHLMLRPTAERVAKLGGLHKFMGWDGPILTDSGGFQVMSLAGLRKLTEEGVTFKSHLDGSKHVMTPERSVEIQHLLDSNITMQLDQCVGLGSTRKEFENGMRLSLRWAKRSYDAFKDRPGYGIFGIVQGGWEKDLREESAKELCKIPFDGYAIGGIAVGEPQKEMLKVLEYTPDFLPQNNPRYLMGVGTLSDIIESVYRGVDMFDCVMPTRAGRTAKAFLTNGEELNLRNACHAEDESPIEEECTCYACKNHSRAYLHHLFRANEMLGPILLTEHNLTCYQRFMKQIRDRLEAGTFGDFYTQWTAAFKNSEKTKKR